MKTMRMMLGCCAALATAVPVPFVSAADVLPLTLAVAEQRMHDNSPLLKQVALGVDAASADIVVAGEAPNPQFSVNSSSINWKNGVGGGNLWDKQIDTVLQLQQQVERGSKRQLRQKAAQSAQQAATADYADAWRTGRLALAQAYYELKFAQDAAATPFFEVVTGC